MLSLCARAGDLLGSSPTEASACISASWDSAALLQHDSLLLCEQDDIFPAAEIGEPGSGILKLAPVALGLALKELVGAGRAVYLQMRLEVQVGEGGQHCNRAPGYRIGIFHQYDVGFPDS